jgi:hypothetical protein
VPIAQVIGGARQRARLAAAHRRYRLGAAPPRSRAHRGQQQIAPAQDLPARQDDADFLAADQLCAKAAAAAQLERQHQARIGRRALLQAL